MLASRENHPKEVRGEEERPSSSVSLQQYAAAVGRGREDKDISRSSTSSSRSSSSSRSVDGRGRQERRYSHSKDYKYYHEEEEEDDRRRAAADSYHHHHHHSRDSSYDRRRREDYYTYQDDYHHHHHQRRSASSRSSHHHRHPPPYSSGYHDPYPSYHHHDDHRSHSRPPRREDEAYYRDVRYHSSRDRDSTSRRPHPPPNNNNIQAKKPKGGASEPPKTKKRYVIPNQPHDENLSATLQKDPRGPDPNQRITQKAASRGVGRNTESFDPQSTLVRPDLRVHVASASHQVYPKPLKHDDVVIVPGLFGPEDDWSLYYKLIQEMTELQQQQQQQQDVNKKQGSSSCDWISWHEGAHLVVKDPTKSPTFQRILQKLTDYFQIDAGSAGTRFNWYRDSCDWKAFHHDSAAFNPTRAKNQNITVGVSFGATRELAFLRATPDGQNNQQQQKPCRLYFPQTNNGVFTFGRDVNIQWKHGVNALPPEEHDGKGRISIILWGLAKNVVEEDNSPPLLGSNGQGPHANNHNNNNKRQNKKRRNQHHNHNLKRRNHGNDGKNGNKESRDNNNNRKDSNRNDNKRSDEK